MTIGNHEKNITNRLKNKFIYPKPASGVNYFYEYHFRSRFKFELRIL